MRQALHKVVQLGAAGGGLHGFHTGPRPGQADVVGDGIVEEVGLLRNPGDLAAENGLIYLIQRRLPQPDPAGGRGHKSQQQVGDSRLARSGSPNQSRGPAGRKFKADVLQGRPAALGVMHSDVFKAHGPQYAFIRRICKNPRPLASLSWWWSLPQQGEDAVGSGYAIHAGMKTLAKLAQRQIKLRGQDEDEESSSEGKTAV